MDAAKPLLSMPPKLSAPRSAGGVAPNPVLGTIGITALYGNNQSLSEDFEEGANAPGWYLPVNWSDDDHGQPE